MAAIKHRVVKIEHVDGAPWDGLQKYISVYYSHLSRHPKLKTDLDKNIEAAETIEKQYLNWLAKFPEADTERNRLLYREQIEYLTLIYSKKEKEVRLKQRRKEVFESVMKK